MVILSPLPFHMYFETMKKISGVFIWKHWSHRSVWEDLASLDIWYPTLNRIRGMGERCMAVSMAVSRWGVCCTWLWRPHNYFKLILSDSHFIVSLFLPLFIVGWGYNSLWFYSGCSDHFWRWNVSVDYLMFLIAIVLSHNSLCYLYLSYWVCQQRFLVVLY